MEQGKFLKEICNNADDFYFGHGSTVQDFNEAYKLYSKAVTLGSGYAYRQLGNMTWSGEGCITDRDHAMELFRKGASLGDNECNAINGRKHLMYHNYLHKENAQKFWKDYFSNLTWDNKNSPEVQSIASYVVLCLSRDISVGFTDEIRHYSGAIIQYLEQSIIRFQRSNLTHRDIAIRDFSNAIAQIQKFITDVT